MVNWIAWVHYCIMFTQIFDFVWKRDTVKLKENGMFSNSKPLSSHMEVIKIQRHNWLPITNPERGRAGKRILFVFHAQNSFNYSKRLSGYISRCTYICKTLVSENLHVPRIYTQGHQLCNRTPVNTQQKTLKTEVWSCSSSEKQLL